MKRFLHIDFLRATAILAVIVIHVLSDNLTNSITTFFWNYLHFIIVAFVFCSGYVMYAFYRSSIATVSSAFLWYKKRLLRLLLPFYWYLLIHYALVFLFPHLFTGLGLVFSWSFFIQSVTLVGGINLNWLPLLFLQLAILFPILLLLYQKKRLLFWGYIGISVLITIYFTIWHFPYDYYREVMWIPWSLIFILPWYFYQMDARQKKVSLISYTLLALGGSLIFTALYLLWQHTGRSLTLIDNKYPPNLFYISYEIMGSFLILLLSMWSFFQKEWVINIYQFFSKASYNLFFIHYIVLDFMLSYVRNTQSHISVWLEVCIVVAVSSAIAWIIERSSKIFN